MRTNEQLTKDVSEVSKAIGKQGLFADGSIVDAPDFPAGCIIGLQALQSAFFRPNMLFLRLPAEESRFKEYGEVMVQANRTGVGVVMLALESGTQHPDGDSQG